MDLFGGQIVQVQRVEPPAPPPDLADPDTEGELPTADEPEER